MSQHHHQDPPTKTKKSQHPSVQLHDFTWLKNPFGFSHSFEPFRETFLGPQTTTHRPFAEFYGSELWWELGEETWNQQKKQATKSGLTKYRQDLVPIKKNASRYATEKNLRVEA